MNGRIDEFGRALVKLTIRASLEAEPTTIEAWVDTAFNGELVIPRNIIETAGLIQSAGIDARLADGSAVNLESFTCLLDWFTDQRPIEVIANEGEYPLLGIGLLIGHRLVVDYTQLTVSIE